MNTASFLVMGMLVAACSENVGSSGAGASPAGGGSQDGGSGGDGGVDVSGVGTELVVNVPADGAVRVDLDTAAIAEDDDGWDLAFDGYDIFTNSGVSGEGSGGAFGPLDVQTFLSDVEPEVPFVLEDRSGGAFVGWYAYEGSTHALWSRYHIYGVRDGDALYKVQILSYYGLVQGAPVSAVYQLRWAVVTDAGSGTTQTLVDVDGTAGGLAGTDDDPSGCLDLASGARHAFTVEEAQSSLAWHLCFRRDTISVNGELGGPGEVGAVDLTRRAHPEDLPVEQVKAKTSDTELGAFDAVDRASLSEGGVVYRGDRIVSAFDTNWYEGSGVDAAPVDAVWLVQSSDGERSFLVFVERFEGPTAASPGAVHLRLKSVSR